MTKKLICITGNFFAITAALEYIVRAFKRRDDIEVITVGPYYGNLMPWEGGMIVPEKYAFAPDIKLPPNTPNVPISYLEYQVRMEKDRLPDYYLDVNAGFYAVGKPQKGKRLTYWTDPHVLRDLYNRIKSDYDLVFNPQISYLDAGEILLPYAADSEWHSPITPKPDKKYHVSLIGNVYAHRVNLFNYLSTRCDTYFKLGVGKEDAREIYNESVIGVNWSSMLDITARCFELAGIGNCIPFYNDVPHLDDYFIEDKHYIKFSTHADFLEKANAVLVEPEKYEHIGMAARENIINNKHTWDDRVQTMLEIIG